MSHECPTCGDEFDSTRAMRVHHSRSHGEKLHKETTCNHCGETFTHKRDPTKPHKYCSVECVGKAKRDRVELECEYCGESFEVPKSESGRRYCSTECGHKDRSKYVKKECGQCGRTYRHYPTKNIDYCSKACQHEARADKPRPDNPYMVLWLFYVYQDWTLEYTYRRIRAYLGNKDRLTHDEIRDALEDMGVYENKHQLNTTLSNMDPDEITSPTPEGDDSWKKLYSD